LVSKNRIVLKFAGFDSIEAAETLRGSEICVAETEAVELEADEFFDWELEDCTVETVEGDRIGTVKEVMRTGGTEILSRRGRNKRISDSVCRNHLHGS
jgi:16S rRNA processing protein RimM